MKKILKSISILLLTLSLVACGTGQNTASADTLYIGIMNTINGFNPVYNTEAAANWVIRMMYPTLLDQPESTVFESNLAESFETTDNKTFTVKLRADAKWSDGTAITADDVAYTLNLAATPDVESSNGTYISTLLGVDASGKLVDGATSIEGVKVVSATELTLTTKAAADPNYIKEMIGFNIFILPKHIVEKLDTKNIGSSTLATAPSVFGGAYKFVKYETGSYVQLEANETYYKGEAKIKNVFVRITDGTGLVTGITSGDLHLLAGGGIGTVTVDDLAALKANDSLTVESSSALSTQLMYINNSVFTSKEIRQAMTYAIDRQKIIDQLLKGEGDKIATMFPQASAYYNKDVAALDYDPAKAKELIAASGFDMSKEITLLVPTGNTIRVASANLIEQDLKAVGFNVKQQTYDFTTMLSYVKKGEFQLALMGLSYNSDPDNTGYFSSDGASNYSKVYDKTVDELWVKGKQTTSKEERLPIYNEIQKIYIEEAYIVGLYSAKQYQIKSKKLTGGITAFWAGSLGKIHEWTLAE